MDKFIFLFYFTLMVVGCCSFQFGPPGSSEVPPDVLEFIKQCEQIAGKEHIHKIANFPVELQSCLNTPGIRELREEFRKYSEFYMRGKSVPSFKKYCHPIGNIKNCIYNSYTVIEKCFNHEQLSRFKNMKRTVNAAVEFVCYRSDDPVTSFINSGGIQCIMNKKDALTECGLAYISKKKEALNAITFDRYFISERDCDDLDTVKNCMLNAVATCDNPTPVNILSSYIDYVLDTTPCGAHSFSPTSFSIYFLALLVAALTTTNVLF